ncbi:MAG: type I-B CRISPR-associated protein Cas8b1/Cst1 [Chloroflexota bacterium]
MTDERAGLFWTNHALVDIGLAALVAYAGRGSPEELTWADLESFAQYAQHALLTKTMRSHASVLFTINTSYLNPSTKEEDRPRLLHELLTSFKKTPGDTAVLCVYCGRPSAHRAYRDRVPMLTGRGVVNFFPQGRHGLPICGFCLLCLQAAAFGAPSCEGRALVIQADDPFITLSFVQEWLPQVRQWIQLSEQTGEKVAALSAPRTRVLEMLVKLERERQRELNRSHGGITVYHLSNSGQGPDVSIYTLPSNVVRFVRLAQTPRYRAQWQALVDRAWEIQTSGKHRHAADDSTRQRQRNYLYEDLFRLPDEAPRFIRVYLLRRRLHLARAGTAQRDPRTQYRGLEEAELTNWNFTELFLREVLGMDTQRIELIRNLGDKLADEIATTNDSRLFKRAYRARRYVEVRRLLLSSSFKRLQRNEEPVVRFHDFLTIFEDGEELARADWRLAWDLVLVRLIDNLYEREWLTRNKEVVEEIEQPLEEEEEEEEEGE